MKELSKIVARHEAGEIWGVDTDRGNLVSLLPWVQHKDDCLDNRRQYEVINLDPELHDCTCGLSAELERIEKDG